MPSGQRVPNFGFVVFETDAAVQACLNKTPVHLPDGHRLNVETNGRYIQLALVPIEIASDWDLFQFRPGGIHAGVIPRSHSRSELEQVLK